ncbi:MAG: HigA family addiction module antitoxin [Tepidisphaeraceae bacterium]|jgi:addiction module HigA family antidote
MRIPTHRPPTTPGEILRELFLEPGGISQLQLARHLGWTPAKVNNIISGRLGITAETALSLADVFGTTPEIWMNAQAATDLWKAGHKHVARKKLRHVARPAA